MIAMHAQSKVNWEQRSTTALYIIKKRVPLCGVQVQRKEKLVRKYKNKVRREVMRVERGVQERERQAG